MKCKICLQIEYKDKLLAPKWDSLQKHANSPVQHSLETHYNLCVDETRTELSSGHHVHPTIL
jgi:hypothetical protein